MAPKDLIKYLPEKIRHQLIRSRLQLGSGAPSRLVFKLAETKDELEQAFQVLHEAYVGQGYMDPHPSGLRVTKYHALPTTAVLIAKDLITGTVVGTVSIVRDTPLGLPLDSIFPLEKIKQQYRHLAEVSSLAIRKEFRQKPSVLLWPLLRYFYTYLREVMHVDAYVIGVNPSWHDLYAGILGFTKLQGFDSASYSFVNNAPVSAYFVDVFEQEFLFYNFYAHLDDSSNFYKYCRKTKLSPSQYKFPTRRYHSVQNTVMSKELFEYFFKEKTDALSLFSPEERRIIQSFYPQEGYSKLLFGENVFLLENLRKANRLICRMPAKIKVGDSFENDIEASLLDFSIKGLRIETSADLSGPVELRISIGKYDSAYVTADIRRKINDTYGLEITTADQAWSDFVAEMQNAFQAEQKSSAAHRAARSKKQA